MGEIEAKCMLGNGNFKRMVKSEAIKEVFTYHSRRPPTGGEREEALKHQILGIIAPLICVPPTVKTILPPRLQKIVPKPPRTPTEEEPNQHCGFNHQKFGFSVLPLRIHLRPSNGRLG
ncbi:hypothetical protein J1N35_008019 [Gossypium stocksii]|uniref:Uncharacterized protein n=1 Tax=Gossypium stocksii TaxID=47602 RepID=A0A9D3W8C1_9ROSI|nr:hypothetical protein J1N35_008019 [Gossypium stocksii]